MICPRGSRGLEKNEPPHSRRMRGPSPNMQNTDSQTVKHKACPKRKIIDIIEHQLDAESILFSRSRHSFTALHLQCVCSADWSVGRTGHRTVDSHRDRMRRFTEPLCVEIA